MRKLLAISFLLLIPFYLFPQNLANGKYWIALADKVGTEYSLANPSAFLSQRSLDRRAKQKISLSQEDLPVSTIYLDSLKNMGLTILGASKWFNAVIVETYDSLLLDTLDRISFVSGFHYKIPRKKTNYNFHFPDRTDISHENRQISGLEYGRSLAQTTIMKGNSLHDLGYLGNGFQIAVIDGGFYRANIYPAFDSLWDEGRLLAHRDFSRAALDFFSTSSHGMSVLSTMAANIPGEIIGTAPKASYYLLKSEIVESETPLEEALWVLAAEFADSAGADIINSSLGYSVFDDPALNYSYSDMDGKTTLVTRAAEKAFSKGIVVVISAGNEGNKAWKYLTAPSDGPNVLSIGATDTLGVVAAFSSRGPSPDMRIKPDILAVGSRTTVVNSSGLVSQGSGTSFAAPLIAGMVACLWETAPEKTNYEVIQAIRRSASHYYNPNDSSGYGMPNFLTAMFLLNTKSPLFSNSGLIAIPNPNSGRFELFSDSISDGEASITISSSTGKPVFAGTKAFSGGFVRIDEMEGKGKGLFLIVARKDGKEYFTKVILL